MKGKAAFVVGVGVGYLFGARAGREQWEKAKAKALGVWHDDRVQEWVHDAEEQAGRLAREQGAALRDKAVDAVRQRFAGTSDEGFIDEVVVEDARRPTTPGTGF